MKNFNKGIFLTQRKKRQFRFDQLNCFSCSGVNFWLHLRRKSPSSSGRMLTDLLDHNRLFNFFRNSFFAFKEEYTLLELRFDLKGLHSLKGVSPFHLDLPPVEKILQRVVNQTEFCFKGVFKFVFFYPRFCIYRK